MTQPILSKNKMYGWRKSIRIFLISKSDYYKRSYKNAHLGLF
jgi:hypothetical protein